MDKSLDEVARGLRAIAARRDLRLEDGAIPPDRLARLQEVLVFEFPLETALFEAAAERDESLSPRASAIPRHVAVALLEKAHRPFGKSTRSFGGALDRFRKMLPTPQMIGAAAAIIFLLFGLFYFGTRRVESNGLREPEREAPAFSPDLKKAAAPHRLARADHFLTSSGGHLALQVSRREVAEAQSSLVTLNHTFSSDAFAAELNLRLDLPVSQILRHAGRNEMP